MNQNTQLQTINKEQRTLTRKVNELDFDGKVAIADQLDTSVILYSLCKRGLNIYRTYKAGQKTVNKGGNQNERRH